MARVDSGGRVVIPLAYRRALGVSPGDEVVLLLEGREVRMLTPREAVARAQSLVRRYVRPGRSLTAELVADRGREVRRAARRP